MIPIDVSLVPDGPAVELPDRYLERMCEHRWFPLLYPRPEAPADRGPSSWLAFYAGRFLEAGGRASAALGDIATRTRLAMAATGRLFVAMDLGAHDAEPVYGIDDGDMLYVVDEASPIDERRWERLGRALRLQRWGP